MKTANCYRVCLLALLYGMASDSLAQARSALPDVLTLREAAELLRTDQETVRLMAEAWTIPGQRMSGGSQHDQWRFSREALMAWLEKRAARSASLLAPEFTENTRQFEAAEQNALRASEPQSQSGGKALGGDVGSRPPGHSAAEMFLRDQSVLLSENEISVDIGVFYVRRDSQVIADPGAPALATVESRTGVLQTVLRYSFRDSTEVFVRASGDSRTDKVYLSGSQLGDTSSSSQGDVDIGIRQVALEEGVNRPEVIVGVEGQLRTGHTSSALSGSVSLLKSLDPAVLFGSLSYKYTDSRDFADIALLEPERTATLTLGYAFALNDALSLNTSVFTEYRERTRFSRAILRENDFSALQLGLTANVAPGVYLQPTVSLGLNGAGSVFSIGLNIPMTFGAD